MSNFTLKKIKIHLTSLLCLLGLSDGSKFYFESNFNEHSESPL